MQRSSNSSELLTLSCSRKNFTTIYQTVLELTRRQTSTPTRWETDTTENNTAFAARVLKIRGKIQLHMIHMITTRMKCKVHARREQIVPKTSYCEYCHFLRSRSVVGGRFHRENRKTVPVVTRVTQVNSVLNLLTSSSSQQDWHIGWNSEWVRMHY